MDTAEAVLQKGETILGIARVTGIEIRGKPGSPTPRPSPKRMKPEITEHLETTEETRFAVCGSGSWVGEAARGKEA